jgi:hypothetical protein
METKQTYRPPKCEAMAFTPTCVLQGSPATTLTTGNPFSGNQEEEW